MKITGRSFVDAVAGNTGRALLFAAASMLGAVTTAIVNRPEDYSYELRTIDSRLNEFEAIVAEMKSDVSSMESRLRSMDIEVARSYDDPAVSSRLNLLDAELAEIRSNVSSLESRLRWMDR
jgi:hypothetical protein